LQRLDRQGEVSDDGSSLDISDSAQDHEARMQTQAHCPEFLSRIPTAGRR
jgi:hypothetical protein